MIAVPIALGLETPKAIGLAKQNKRYPSVLVLISQEDPFTKFFFL
jgi:hypothetical protein